MQRLIVYTLLLALGLFAIARLIGPSARDAAAGAGEPQLLAPEHEPAGATAFTDEIVIPRDGSGQFRLAARVDGQDARFVVDTGADVVALTEAEAERLGLDVSPGDFQPILRTASGTGNGARVRIDSLELDGEELRDVDAVVAQGLSQNLLGRSVLSRLGRVEMQGDRMVIEHR